MSEEQRFVYTADQAPTSVDNSQIAGGMCATCRYRQTRAGRCDKYDAKPLDVLAGRRVCEFYTKDGAPEHSPQDAPEHRFQVDVPPCVGCAYNDGALACRSLGVKPERVVLGHEPCEKREDQNE